MTEYILDFTFSLQYDYEIYELKALLSKRVLLLAACCGLLAVGCGLWAVGCVRWLLFLSPFTHFFFRT
jgi:hypothetical protein